MEKELIEKILRDAEKIAADTLAEAQAEADAISAQAEADAQKVKNRAQSVAKERTDGILSRAKTVAELDANKVILKAKVDLIHACFEQAKQRMLKLPKAEYAKYLARLIEKNAEDGDAVVFAKKDIGVLSDSDVQKIAAKKKIKLSVSPELGEFSGGVVLQNCGIDKNLTLEMQLKECYNEHAREVTALLSLA